MKIKLLILGILVLSFSFLSVLVPKSQAAVCGGHQYVIVYTGVSGTGSSTILCQGTVAGGLQFYAVFPSGFSNTISSLKIVKGDSLVPYETFYTGTFFAGSCMNVRMPAGQQTKVLNTLPASFNNNLESAIANSTAQSGCTNL